MRGHVLYTFPLVCVSIYVNVWMSMCVCVCVIGFFSSWLCVCVTVCWDTLGSQLASWCEGIITPVFLRPVKDSTNNSAKCPSWGYFKTFNFTSIIDETDLNCTSSLPESLNMTHATMHTCMAKWSPVNYVHVQLLCISKWMFYAHLWGIHIEQQRISLWKSEWWICVFFA